jgi:polar amino acid transport system substrate-binding protein
MRLRAAAAFGLGALAWAALALWPVRSHAEPAGASSPDAALAQLIAKAKAQAAEPGACAVAKTDRLARIFCAGKIRIAVRDHYPLFAMVQDGVWRGYDVDVARAVAAKLGVAPVLSRVGAASRIAVLAEDQADVTIATMGHDTARDGQARFIRPHYYQSQTVVLGPRAANIADWSDVAGRLICVTVGSGSNAELVEHHARLMLFDDPAALVTGLPNGTCPLAAQDDSFFASYLTEPDFTSRFDEKFGFAPVPWGMAVAPRGSDQLATALDYASQIFHRDGVFLEIARQNKVATGFLQQQQAVWSRPDCNTADGHANPACVLPPLDMNLQRTRFAGAVESFEHWLAAATGLTVSLPMFELAPAWSLFKSGLLFSLVLVAGALLATLCFAVALAAALLSETIAVRLLARAVVVTMQSSPIVLTLVMTAAICHAFFAYSGTMALCAAIVALGLANGANAGQAIAEAVASLRAERGEIEGTFIEGLRCASMQIFSFLVNAAKGAPVASFIGAPELLNALTDVTSFSANGRETTYALVLVFYLAVIAVVVWLCRRLEAALGQGLAHP